MVRREFEEISTKGLIVLTEVLHVNDLSQIFVNGSSQGGSFSTPPRVVILLVYVQK